MSIEALLTRMHDLDVKFYVEGDRLHLSAPKGVLTSALQTELVQRKREIIDYMRQVSTISSTSVPELTPIAREGNLLLSFAQQRLWFLHHLTPDIPVYNIPFGLRFVGKLDVAALEKSLNEIVRRHESLRTTFTTIDGQPVQTISDPEPFTLRVIDLRDLPAAEREVETRQITERDTQQPFDLEHGPLFQTKLLRLGDQEYGLLTPMHHIVSDGWSLEVFKRELAALYRAFSVGQASPLPELAIQYADFAQWQRDWLTGDVLETQLAYWRKQLAPRNTKSLPVLALPTDHPRPESQTFRGATQSFSLSRELSDGLEALSRREESTLFMTLLAAFQTLLFRYSGQDDILIGSPIANRNRTEIEGLIGFFINTLVLRTDLSGDPTFLELLRRVRNVALEAYAHQDIPFEKLVEELQPERDLSRPTFFQVMFVLEVAPSQPLDLPWLSMTSFELGNGTSKFDLTLSIRDEKGILKGLLEYNTDLFEERTIRRMVGHFKTLLEGIATDPQMRISILALLTAPERRQLLMDWNDTQVEYSKDKCVQNLVEEQVERTPDDVALLFGQTQLTFAQLNARANQLAHYLRALGVEPDTRVGICAERSVEMVVGLLGILKAGGAYVPLDPAYPAERLAFMLADAQVRMLLTQEALLSNFPEHSTRTLCLDRDWREIANAETLNPSGGVSPENLAYVIYTSGSTGRPKGVAMPHRALSNLLQWQLQNFSLSIGARTIQFTSPSFDVSFQEIFSTCCSGGSLILVSEEVRRDPVQLLRFINEQAIERIFLPFVALKQLAEASQLEGIVPMRLREIITAGEQLQVTPPLVNLMKRLEHCVLCNQYGPTESHVVTEFTLRGDPESWETLPPIGRPIANTEIYILDQQLQPLPIGVPGELHIGGRGLARGYLNRPDLTAQRFIPDRFSRDPGARLYKTGDLARYLPDGNIEFLGRLDNQVKIRGFRIELGEIEASLRQQPAIREAVVEARDKEGVGKRLVAYVVPSAPDGASPGELRNALKQKLPEYMVPAVFVKLEALPLTPSGKVDRRALPEPDQTRERSPKSRIELKDPLQIQLIKIWEEILRVRPIGVRENFFDLGGHSLLALRLFADIEKRLGKKLPIATLFRAPTVEQLAALIRKTGNPPYWSTLVPIQPEGTNLPIFCVHAGDGHPLRYPPLAQHLGSEQPLYALQSPGMNGEAPLHHTIEEMAAHYVQEIQAVQPAGPYMLAGLSMGGYVAFEMAQQLCAQGNQVGLLALFDTSIGNVQAFSPTGRLRYQARQWATRLQFHVTKLITLPPPQKLNHVLQWIRRRFKGDVEQQMAARRLAERISGLPPQLQEVWKANLLAMRQYVPKQYPGTVVLFRSEEGEGMYYGWQELAKGGVQIHLVPGSHTGILEEPHVQVLAERLRTCIAQAQATAHYNPRSNQEGEDGCQG